MQFLSEITLTMIESEGIYLQFFILYIGESFQLFLRGRQVWVGNRSEQKYRTNSQSRDICKLKPDLHRCNSVGRGASQTLRGAAAPPPPIDGPAIRMHNNAFMRINAVLRIMTHTHIQKVTRMVRGGFHEWRFSVHVRKQFFYRHIFLLAIYIYVCVDIYICMEH